MHIRRPLIFPIVFFLSGAVASAMWAGCLKPGHFSLFVGISVLLILLMFFFKGTNVFYVFCVLFFFLLGSYRYETSRSFDEKGIDVIMTNAIDKEITIRGVVEDYPEKRDTRYSSYSMFCFRMYRILADGAEYKVDSKVLVRSYSLLKTPSAGDELVMSGLLMPVSDKKCVYGAGYRGYLENRGISFIFSSKENDIYLKTGERRGLFPDARRFLFKLRRNADRVIKRHFAGIERSILRSIVLGLRGDMPAALKDVFKKTGTMHILAVSGLHAGVVGCVLLGILSIFKCPRSVSYPLTIIMLAGYAVFTGGRISTQRAVIMGSLILMARLLDRRPDMFNILFVSAFVIALLQPRQLLQPGAILSYAAVMSILCLKPLFDGVFRIPERAKRENAVVLFKRVLLNSVSVSLAVSIGTMPIVARYFGIISFLVVPANLLAVPILFGLVIMGNLLVLTGATPALAFLTKVIACSITGMVRFLIAYTEILSRISLGSVKTPVLDIRLLVCYYAFLGMIIYFSTKKRKKPSANRQ